MKKFIHDDFLLQNNQAKELYHSYVENLPICDYHCHLDPSDIEMDIKYKNIAELWLSGDHYKWRAMRFAGIEENYITGDADPKDKFLKWAEIMPVLIGNPLYHFTHLELARYFGITKLLNKKNAEFIWDECNEKLLDASFSARNLIKRSNVIYIGTTDDPADSLDYHKKLKKEKFSAYVAPTFRPDKYITIEVKTFAQTVNKLGISEGVKNADFNGYLDLLKKRVKYFNENGCCMSDFSLEIIDFKQTTVETAEAIYNRAVKRVDLSNEDIVAFQSFMIVYLGRIYHSYNWVMQIHTGAQRNNSNRMLGITGINTGFDSISDQPVSLALSKILNALDITDELPKTILYTLNPSANAVISSLIGAFQGGGISGKIQFGSAWWFNDHFNGMREQLQSFSNMGVLGLFIGMLTDSRCLLSYTRHEYFRRILCQLLGEWMEHGLAPDDIEEIGNIACNISYRNIQKYLSL